MASFCVILEDDYRNAEDGPSVQSEAGERKVIRER